MAYPSIRHVDDVSRTRPLLTNLSQGSFYAWHRGFLELFENALRGECGYKGGQPYFDWPQHAATLDKNELFDGSEYSIGSNGAYVPGRPSVVLGPYLLPPGSGGGCVKSGPFSNYTVPFRSFNLTEAFQGGPPATGYVEAPHCLTRDLNNVIASRYLNSSSERAALAATSLTAFDLVVQGNFSTSEIGMHGGGHFAGGGQMFDFFASPEDPFFFFHHGYVDRLWDRWQHAGPGRFLQIFGTQTFNNIPPSAPATIDDLVEWGCLGPAKRIRDVVQLGRNGYCSQYD